jgi:hypothetical protein
MAGRAEIPGFWRGAAAIALASMLGACSATGSSTFQQAMTIEQAPADLTGSVDETPLIAPAPEQSRALSLAEEEAAQQPVAVQETAAAPVETAAAPLDAPLRPDSQQEIAAEEPVQMAALAQPQPGEAMETSLALPAGDDAEPVIDPLEAAAQERIPALFASIKHGECKGGWGPKPARINATRLTPGEPYYMEMRLRHTPMLPVGHVYIAYGRLGENGEPLDEKLIMLAPLGGYAGAGVSSALPMPGVMTPFPDDCSVTPHAAYRLSLSAQQYEKLLLAVKEQKQKKPNYLLFAYNCNHFMSDVAKSVGILPPENIYQPSLVYFYEMMDRNEGYKVPRTPQSEQFARAG